MQEKKDAFIPEVGVCGHESGFVIPAFTGKDVFTEPIGSRGSSSLAGRLHRLGAHVADIADTLGLTAARIPAQMHSERLETGSDALIVAILNFVAGVLAFAAAGLWWWASAASVPIPKKGEPGYGDMHLFDIDKKQVRR